LAAAAPQAVASRTVIPADTGFRATPLVADIAIEVFMGFQLQAAALARLFASATGPRQNEAASLLKP
jgi:hypothetical protein